MHFMSKFINLSIEVLKMRTVVLVAAENTNAAIKTTVRILSTSIDKLINFDMKCMGY